MVDVFAAKAPLGADLDPESAAARRSAHYLPRAASGRSAAAIFSWLCRSPVRLVSTFALCLSGRYRDDAIRCRLRAPVHFVVGVALAETLRRRGAYARIHAQFLDAGSTAAFVASRLLGLPLSIANHTAYNPYQLDQKLAHADRILSISEFDRELLFRQCGVKVDRKKFVISRVGIRLSDWTGLPRNPEPRRVLVVAALREKKGHCVLIRAAAILAARGEPVKLVFAGDGREENALRALAAQTQVSVEFLGAASPAQVRAELTRAAVFCLPCVVAKNGDLDGIPVALMEAMAAHVPVVSTHLSGIPELIDDGVSGFLALPGDAASLADVLSRVLGEGDALSRACLRARESVAERHDLLKTSARLAAILTGSAA